MPKKLYAWKATTILSVIGIILACYLLYNFINKPLFQPCSINATVNCDAVTKGPISTIFGIPVALIGLIGYITILIASILKHKKLLLGMSAFGMIFCLRLTIIEVFFLKVLCPVCLACQIDMLIVFIIAVYLLRNRASKSK